MLLLLFYCVYGISATIVGVIGILHPCNYETLALVTACTPGEVLGQTLANITYADYRGVLHDGTIRLVTAVSCVAGQHVDICYPRSSPDAFRDDDRVVMRDPNVAKALLITGVPGCIAALVTMFCFSSVFLPGTAATTTAWSRVV